MAEMTIPKKKEYAKLLYLQGSYTQKDIAEKVGITEKTIGNWIKKSNWEQLRVSITITKEEELRRLYQHLSRLNTVIEERDSNVPTSGEADVISKIGSAIKKMEGDASVSDIIEVGKQFITWLQSVDVDNAKIFVMLFDSFIKDKMK